MSKSRIAVNYTLYNTYQRCGNVGVLISLTIITLFAISSDVQLIVQQYNDPCLPVK